jgi:NAD(P)-dependent dehydrogenase (short-subunit alcohol dehydrogenase family)
MADDRRVLVTGASSGIGRATALLLDRSGFTVHAGVMSAAEADALRGAASERMRPVTIDVTDAASIATAVEEVSSEVAEHGLTGLVNNAGIAAVGPLEYLAIDRIRKVFEVNVFGLLAVTQAFAPLIRRGDGRVVNISSVGAWISLPYVSPINASKAAVESFNDALRMELAPFGIEVIAVEPGSIRTPGSEGMDKAGEQAIATLPEPGREQYGTRMRGFVQAMSRMELKGSPPEVVAKTVLTALSDPSPRTRYPSGSNARLLSWLGRLVPNPLLDRLRARLFR